MKLERLLRTQEFWITLVVALLIVAMCFVTESFGTYDNLYNISRNFAFIGIMAVGQNAVIISGGIDLSVGAVMGLAGITTALVLGSGYPLEAGVTAGLLVAALCGFVNGLLVARLRLSPFVVTLGMMSIARSLALVVSNNRTLYQMGPDEALFLKLGGGSFLGVSNPLLVLIFTALCIGLALKYLRWGRYLYAIGGNEEAASLTGVPVAGVKISAYVLSSLTAGIAAVLTVGWMGSASNSLGAGYELQVIAASVIGGANLLGGEGGAFGAIIGAALIEVIRNSLLLAGVDPYWQGTFVGLFIIVAVVLEKMKKKVSNT